VTDIADLLRIKWGMGLEGSVLIANPVHANQETDPDQTESIIREALSVADERCIKGKQITPFLLGYIAEHTSGESLDTNIALIKNNARLAAEIAVSFSTLSIN
jgi:pseudouridine-5'-phosphate glycosidase